MDNIKRKKLAEESKPLSEMLEETEAHKCVDNYYYVDGKAYDRMKRVAIELAKACEDRHDGWSICVYECRKTCEALSRAKDIIGEVSK